MSGFFGGSSGGSVPLRTILERSTAQNIANNTNTDVSWDTTPVIDEVGAFSAGTPTQVTVPAGKTKMKVTIRGNWQSNSTGARIVDLIKDGASLESFIRVGSFESSIQIPTRWYAVAEGQVYKVRLNQQSGVALNFGGQAAYANPYVEFEWA